MNVVLNIIFFSLCFLVGWFAMDGIRTFLRNKRKREIDIAVALAMNEWLTKKYPMPKQAPLRRWNDLDPPPDPGLPEKTVKPTNRR